MDQAPESKEDKEFMYEVPYVNALGSLMYAMVRHSYSISLVSRFMANPGMAHWQALKWILRYIKGSIGKSLVYGEVEGYQENTVVIEGFVDSDFAGCLDTRKSLTGYVFTAFGTAISCKTSLQKVVALSTIEVEYIALTEAIKEALWLRGIARELKRQDHVITVHCDNQSVIHLSKNQIYHERTKHVDVKLHFMREIIVEGAVFVKKVSTEYNPSDMITKVLPSSKFFYCLDLINLK